MMMKPLVKESLLLLNIVGLHPINQNAWSKIRLAITFFLMLGTTTELLLEIIVRWDGLNSIANIPYFMGFYQMSFRGFILIVNRQKFTEALSMLENFWTPNQYESDRMVETDAQAVYRIAKKIMKCIYRMHEIFATLAFCVFYVRRELIFKTYHYFTKSPNYDLEHLILFVTSILVIPLILGFDFLYSAIIIQVICELKIIKQKIRTLPINLEVNHDEETCLKELALLIDQHNLVLRFIKKMNEIYSMMMLNQFLTCIFSFATILIAVTASPVAISANQYSMYGFYICTYMGQLYFFCFGGSFVTTECESVSDAAYECQWWAKTQPKLRNSIVLIIQRAQKQEMLAAGGFFPVNLQTFTRIVNTAGSFFSVLLAAYRNRGED